MVYLYWRSLTNLGYYVVTNVVTNSTCELIFYVFAWFLKTTKERDESLCLPRDNIRLLYIEMERVTDIPDPAEEKAESLTFYLPLSCWYIGRESLMSGKSVRRWIAHGENEFVYILYTVRSRYYESYDRCLFGLIFFYFFLGTFIDIFMGGI